MRIEIEVQVPHGYEVTSAYVGAPEGAIIINPYTGFAFVVPDDSWKNCRCIHLRRIEPPIVVISRKYIKALESIIKSQPFLFRLSDAQQADLTAAKEACEKTIREFEANIT